MGARLGRKAVCAFGESDDELEDKLEPWNLFTSYTNSASPPLCFQLLKWLLVIGTVALWTAGQWGWSCIYCESAFLIEIFTTKLFTEIVISITSVSTYKWNLMFIYIVQKYRIFLCPTVIQINHSCFRSTFYFLQIVPCTKITLHFMNLGNQDAFKKAF